MNILFLFDNIFGTTKLTGEIVLARINNKGLRISAELHEKLAESSEAIKELDSEVLAVRKSIRTIKRKTVTDKDYQYVHIYGS